MYVQGNVSYVCDSGMGVYEPDATKVAHRSMVILVELNPKAESLHPTVSYVCESGMGVCARATRTDICINM